MAVTSDPSSVESIFRRYRSVAHICAARVSSAGYLAVAHLWDETAEVPASLIQTSAEFQTALEEATDTTLWNLWDVTKHFPSILGGWPVLTPEDDLLFWVKKGFDLAIEQGLIQRQRGGR